MLPQMERDRLVAEWCRLVGKENKPRQLDEVSRGGRGNKDGNAEAARQLGLSEPDVRRAIKVASITPEAQQAAHEVGNQKQAIAGICQPLGAIGGHLVDKLFPCPANCFTQK